MVGFVFGPSAQLAWADNSNQPNAPVHPGARVVEGVYGLACVAVGARAVGAMVLPALLGGFAGVSAAGLGTVIFFGVAGLGAMALGGLLLWDAVFNKGKLMTLSSFNQP